MTITEKYNFKVSVDQFGTEVSPDYIDAGEVPMIEIFEKACLELMALKNPHYAMIELGSNQAYYSLLFKHIIGKNITTTILVEPMPVQLERGKSEFRKNDCRGVFYNRGIGDTFVWPYHHKFAAKPITIGEIFKENSLKRVDILHCDIDGSEMVMLNENAKIFKQSLVTYVFIALHSIEWATQCKDFFKGLNYELIFDSPLGGHGGDGWAIYKQKTCS